MQAQHITMTAPLISPGALLAVYCVLVLLASLAGGWLLLAVHLTHTRLQMAVSFVAGLMLGIALLHFLPDAAEQLHSLDRTVNWLLGGFLVMFFVQRFFHFHHHDLPEGDPEGCCGHDPSPAHEHGEHARRGAWLLARFLRRVVPVHRQQRPAAGTAIPFARPLQAVGRAAGGIVRGHPHRPV